MPLRPRHVFFLALLAVAPLRAGWTSLSSAGPPQKIPGGVEYAAPEGLIRLTVAGNGIVRVRFTHAKEFAPDDSWAVIPSPSPDAIRFVRWSVLATIV